VGTGFRGLYLEANAVAPARAERIAALLGERGARLVDGAVIARRGLNLYLSGETEDVEEVAAIFADSDVRAIPLAGGAGAASALKMAFGGWNKIGIALEAQAYAIARAYGVEQALGEEGVESERVVHAGQKAWRWAPEMEEVAEDLRDPRGARRNGPRRGSPLRPLGRSSRPTDRPRSAPRRGRTR
jgi:3-hydroxyisobutyrate dehydrogenase-like beta-hydroxyacid dehydrogenase